MRTAMFIQDKVERSNFAIIFLQENVPQFQKLELYVPLSKTIKDLLEYLAKYKKNPFSNFFLTNKIK